LPIILCSHLVYLPARLQEVESTLGAEAVKDLHLAAILIMKKGVQEQEKSL